MSVLILSAEAATALAAAIERARAKPIPWEVMREHLPTKQRTGELRLEDRTDDKTWRPQAEIVELPIDFRFNVSFEEQPAGLLLHVSMSHRDRCPRADKVRAVLIAAGLGDRPIARVWEEEFLVDGQPTGRAINILYMERANPMAPGVH